MTQPPLEGVRVLDVATLFAAPLAATFLGDFGADVIKVEHPKGDPIRGHGHAKKGAGLWAKMVNRNKRMLTLNLSDAGTIAESLSGFAAITGQPEGPPTLPPFGLADGIAGLAGAMAILMALYARDKHDAGQVIDLAIIEPILTILGAQVSVYDQLGIVQQRTGNRSANNAPRNTYRTRDDNWVAISTSAQSIAERVMRLVGHPEVIDQPWFATGTERAEHADELDAYVASWIAERDQSEVIDAFEAAEAAIAPIYDAADIARDPQYAALDSIISVPDEELGPLKMQNVLFRMLGTPGKVRWSGRRLGQDTQAILGELGLAKEHVADLRTRGVV